MLTIDSIFKLGQLMRQVNFNLGAVMYIYNDRIHPWCKTLECLYHNSFC